MFAHVAEKRSDSAPESWVQASSSSCRIFVASVNCCGDTMDEAVQQQFVEAMQSVTHTQQQFGLHSKNVARPCQLHSKTG